MPLPVVMGTRQPTVATVKAVTSVLGRQSGWLGGAYAEC